MDKLPCVYILANQRNGTLYTGVTSDLPRRVWKHKQDFVAGFSQYYRVHRLVWYAAHESMYYDWIPDNRYAIYGMT